MKRILTIFLFLLLTVTIYYNDKTVVLYPNADKVVYDVKHHVFYIYEGNYLLDTEHLDKMKGFTITVEYDFNVI